MKRLGVGLYLFAIRDTLGKLSRRVIRAEREKATLSFGDIQFHHQWGSCMGGKVSSTARVGKQLEAQKRVVVQWFYGQIHVPGFLASLSERETMLQGPKQIFLLQRDPQTMALSRMRGHLIYKNGIIKENHIVCCEQIW